MLMGYPLHHYNRNCQMNLVAGCIRVCSSPRSVRSVAQVSCPRGEANPRDRERGSARSFLEVFRDYVCSAALMLAAIIEAMGSLDRRYIRICSEMPQRAPAGSLHAVSFRMPTRGQPKHHSA